MRVLFFFVWGMAILLCAHPTAYAAAEAAPFAHTLVVSLASKGLQPGALAQPKADHPLAPRVFRDFVNHPAKAWDAVDSLAQLPALGTSPEGLWQALRRHTGFVDANALAVKPSREADAPSIAPFTAAGSIHAVRLPADMPEPLATELQHMLNALVQAEAWRVQAFKAMPADTSSTALMAGLLPAGAGYGHAAPASHLAWPQLLPLVDTQAFHAGGQVLVAAAQRLHRFVTHTPNLPPIVWRAETAHGTVLVDTTGNDNHHVVTHPLFLLDVGGNDHYELGGAALAPAPGIRVLIDHEGDDQYSALAPGAGPSSAVMGYGLLWDTSGNDQYEAGWLAQGAAVLGVAWHVDDAGHNTYRAIGMAQAFSWGGDALLISSPGNDSYTSQTLSQASAGPGGLSLLLDPGGNDHYQLRSDQLVWPSPQLPDRNASLGQGAGFGSSETAGAASPSETWPGGVAVLIDAGGNDIYRADVFAQGSGLRQGTGLLLDLAGSNQFAAAWYAMGSAAHQAVGVLWSAGGGADQYHASHVTSLGAGHDASIGMLVDAGGSDQFTLDDLGLGAAHDGGHGVFIHRGPQARYQFTGSGCRGLGTRHTSQIAEPDKGYGLFLPEHPPSRFDNGRSVDAFAP